MTPVRAREPLTRQQTIAEGFVLTRRRVPELDGLRGIAILLVLICHYFVNIIKVQQGSPLQYLKGLLSLSWSGVDLFFVLSGFLIGSILIETRGSPNYFKTFYTRRFFRILPIYYLSLALYVAVKWLGAGREGLSWLTGDNMPIASFVSFTQNIVMAVRGTWGANWTNVTWSLAIEEQFYLFLPLVIRFVPTHHLPVALAAGVVSAPLLRTVLWATGANVSYSGYALMPCRADGLALGVLAAVYVRKPAVANVLRLHPRLYLAATVVLGFGIVVMTALRASSESLLLNSIGYTWIAVFYLALLVAALIWSDKWLGARLRSRWLAYLGGVSYFVYLFHQPINGLTHFFLFSAEPRIDGLPSALATLVALCVTLAIARLSWIYFEKPLIDRGHRTRY